MKAGKKAEAEEAKAKVNAAAEHLAELEALETELAAKVREIMLVIPNIIDESVPIGKDDSENVEIERFGEPVVPDFEIPYHTDIMERFCGIDLDSARRVAGNGFYYRFESNGVVGTGKSVTVLEIDLILAWAFFMM